MPTAFVRYEGEDIEASISQKTHARVIRLASLKNVPTQYLYHRTLDVFGIFHEWTILRYVKSQEDPPARKIYRLQRAN